MSGRQNSTQALVVGLGLAAVASLIMYQMYKENATAEEDVAIVKKKAADKSRDVPKTSSIKTVSSEAATPLVNNTSGREEKALHMRIEELDKKGKTSFKNKKYLEAADAFTEALDLIATHEVAGAAPSSSSEQSTSLARQVITLTNNRSAMYEKGGLADLALSDCTTILDREVGHVKARTRSLRILEAQSRYAEALVQVCALQLKFMQDNRTQLRMGVPLQPPVPQQKLEEMISHLIPAEVEKYMELAKLKDDRPLPSQYTLTQLLKSFTGYNAWMSKAARSGSVSTITPVLDLEEDPAKKASLFLKRGRRHVHDKSHAKAAVDFEAGLALVVDSVELQDMMEEDDYARLLEWAGMARHWKYDLEGALNAYEKCSELEPTNPEILVKRAGVKMDGGEHDAAVELFDTALGLDPETTDALLHRANLRLLQQKVDEAKADLLQCLKVRPDHLLARLRLATLLMAVNDVEGTKQQLDKAEKMVPNSSEVHSYRGEMHFAQGELEDAKMQFQKAIDCEPSNPTPYVNVALAIMNTPPTAGGPPDAAGAITMLEKAIAVDPQMHSAYMHLGQLKLAMATDLSVARTVIELYDQALDNCRTPDEMRDICGVRLLTEAQVDAATMLKMETFSMQ